MAELETKLVCPHCGGKLHRKPYLMESHPDARAPRWASTALWLLLFLFVVGALVGLHS